MKKIVLFDLDGTLIDSTEAILESFHHSLRELNHTQPFEDEAIKALIGHPLDVMFTRLGCETSKIDEHVLVYKEHYRTISRAKTVLLPFAVEAVEIAAKHARLGIVTTKTARYSRELMEHFGLMHYFEVLIGHEDVDNHKPHPAPIHKALEGMDHALEEVWMIGDTRLDLEASQRAGVDAVGVLSGYDNFEELSIFKFPIKDNALEAVHHIIKRG
ncbi:MAG TPA: HAD family hydrolase [Sulfuricurvum sp.]|nr:MAG: hydrolase [Campylobacterales bacterium 16-40-21]OZA01841.1 MAG: hydrolase [Sulfuricurvum sp. 17-40-25]HQS67226.1 HAD family hydrolase [Sulfuricurvum sp.]HQT36027.1 HAD family hydrolase [Sulfuricurvum sp.]